MPRPNRETLADKAVAILEAGRAVPDIAAELGCSSQRERYRNDPDYRASVIERATENRKRRRMEDPIGEHEKARRYSSVNYQRKLARQKEAAE
jgi:hypothetical protein